MAQCASGAPTRFLTLTVNPRVGNSPSDRLRLLANAWRNAVKRLRRAQPHQDFEYLAIVEETKNGEPHLHILLRSPYIAQRTISRYMAELIESPIVDIRRIRGAKEVIRYVAKYITKAPKQFDRAKRYWKSQNYDESENPVKKTEEVSTAKWVIERTRIHDLMLIWHSQGMWVGEAGPNHITAFYGTLPPIHPPWRLLDAYS